MIRQLWLLVHHEAWQTPQHVMQIAWATELLWLLMGTFILLLHAAIVYKS